MNDSESNRPWRRHTPLHQIFVKTKIPPAWRSVCAADVFPSKHRWPALLGHILLACTEEQVRFVSCLWDHVHLDNDTILTFRALVKQGMLLEILDPQDKLARKIMQAALAGVAEARVE